MHVAFSVADLVAWLQPARSAGTYDGTVRGIAALSQAFEGDLSFLGNPKYKLEVPPTQASVVLLPLDYVGEPRPGQAYLFVEKPSVALAKVCARIEALIWPTPTPGVHPSAVIAPSARVDGTASVGPLCVIEEGAVVGAGSVLEAQVFVGPRAAVGQQCWLMTGAKVLTECVLQDRVRLQAGVVIGSDGFGYEFVNGRHVKVPQVGNVVVESDVEIGANATIDRARFSQTRIGAGSKIDNLVQIGHNVVVGQHVILCAQVGVSGSSTIGDYVVIGGQAGLAGHLTVGKGSKIDGQTGVNTDLEPGSFVKGSPCLPYNLEQRINVLRKRIPDLFKRVDALEERLGK